MPKLVVCFSLFILGLVANVSATPVSLNDASQSLGYVIGAQQRLAIRKMHFKSFRKGLEEAYSQSISTDEYEQAKNLVSTSGLSLKETAGKVKKIDKQILKDASFSVGTLVAQQAKQELANVDAKSFVKGFKRAFSLSKTDSPAIARATIAVSDYRRQLRMIGSEERLKKSNAFLEDNKNNKNIVVTKSGLQYQMLKAGEGPSPNGVDKIMVKYRHTNADGELIYDSFAENHDEMMAVEGAVPPGWTEAFLLMKKGSRFRVFLPPHLGFKGEGIENVLKPNDVMISEFEILDIISP